MYNYEVVQMERNSRYRNGIRALKILKVDDSRGLTLPVPGTDSTFEIMPRDFEIGGYEADEYVDCQIHMDYRYGSASLRSARFISRTPEAFTPKNGELIGN